MRSVLRCILDWRLLKSFYKWDCKPGFRIRLLSHWIINRFYPKFGDRFFKQPKLYIKCLLKIEPFQSTASRKGFYWSSQSEQHLWNVSLSRQMRDNAISSYILLLQQWSSKRALTNGNRAMGTCVTKCGEQKLAEPVIGCYTLPTVETFLHQHACTF